MKWRWGVNPQAEAEARKEQKRRELIARKERTERKAMRRTDELRKKPKP